MLIDVTFTKIKKKYDANNLCSKNKSIATAMEQTYKTFFGRILQHFLGQGRRWCPPRLRPLHPN